MTVRKPVTDTTFKNEVLHAAGPVCIHHPRRELARRINGGIEVTLYWSAHDNSTSVEVWQPASGETLLFTVARGRALEAFYHPFAYLPIGFDELTPALNA